MLLSIIVLYEYQRPFRRQKEIIEVSLAEESVLTSFPNRDCLFRVFEYTAYMARPSENQENESSQTAASQQTRSNKGKGKQREMPKTTTAQAMDIISDKSEPEEEESDDDSGRGRRSTQDQEATVRLFLCYRCILEGMN